MSVFEAVMLICFGAAWPMNIYKSYKARTAAGKSLMFQLAVTVGYISGIIHKLLYSNDFVLYLYILNLVMISIDTALWFRNHRLDAEREAAVRAQESTPAQ